MSPSYQKPAIPASVMLGDRDLTAARASEWFSGSESDNQKLSDAAVPICGFISRRCFKRSLARRQQRRVPA